MVHSSFSNISKCTQRIIMMQVVTSRMGGRRSASSRCSSSRNDSLHDDGIETIQWKRGNQLGKGAYGTVSIRTLEIYTYSAVVVLLILVILNQVWCY